MYSFFGVPNFCLDRPFRVFSPPGRSLLPKPPFQVFDLASFFILFYFLSTGLSTAFIFVVLRGMVAIGPALCFVKFKDLFVVYFFEKHKRKHFRKRFLFAPSTNINNERNNRKDKNKNSKQKAIGSILLIGGKSANSMTSKSITKFWKKMVNVWKGYTEQTKSIPLATLDSMCKKAGCRCLKMKSSDSWECLEWTYWPDAVIFPCSLTFA